MSLCMTFERLPDELLLQICRFLPPADVLYSLFNLNSRLNRTIFIYRQHIVFRRTSFIQFEYLCLNILPKIGSTIRSLCINANWTDLLAKQFLVYFGHQMKDIFPNLEHLTLVACNGTELNDYMSSISDLPYLNKLTIHDRYNITEEYKQILFDKILSANQNRLEKIFFNRHSESLSINEINPIIYSNIIQLSIHLDNINDLHCLLKLIPNIRQLNIIINKQLEDNNIKFDEFLMNNLIEFHIESFRRSWIFDEICSLLKQMPFLKYLSLDLFSQDFRLFDGQQFLSILPLNSLQRFNYAIDYEPEGQIESVENIISSWTSTPFPVCCLVTENKTHMFLHTIPYGFSYLDISSVFVQYMDKKTDSYSYRINELLLFNVSTLAETFIAIRNCNRVKDLGIEMQETSSILTEDKQEMKMNISLPDLNRLNWLSIDGCPHDAHLMKEILAVSPNLCMLVLDMKFLLQLIDIDDDQSCNLLLKNRIKHFSIQISDEETELNDINLGRLADIFTRVSHIIVENKLGTNLSVENVLLLFLHHFKTHPLVSIIIRGSTTEQLRNNPSQWLINHTYLKEHIGQFQAECDEIEFKIWL